LDKNETAREIQIKTNKYNSNRILHERNIYVFLASVAEDALNSVYVNLAEISGFLLVKKLIMTIENL
jgi:serine/threonine-protein kinase ULK/ATG1